MDQGQNRSWGRYRCDDRLDADRGSGLWDNTLHVEREAIQIRSEQVLIPTVETFISSRAGQITEEQFSCCLIIGETDQGCVIAYYLPDGDVGMIPMSSLGNGNG